MKNFKKLFTIYYSLLADSKGQVMPIFFMLMIAALMCWMMMLNVGRLTYERIAMQNAADNTALSLATYKARVLNKLGVLNHLIGTQLYGTELGVANYYLGGAMGGGWCACPQVGPAIFMLFWNSQKKVGCIPDMSHGFCGANFGDIGLHEGKQFVSAIRNLVKGMVTAQESFRLPFPGLAAIYGRQIARRHGAQEVVFNPGFLSLGLKRNERGIKYYATKSLCFSWPPIPFVTSGGHAHVFWTDKYADENKSWLYIDNRNQFDEGLKVTVVATRASSAAGFPYGRNLFGIFWPPFITVASAAAYNPDINIRLNDGLGPMFPTREEDRITPVITSYRNAENPGWRAHLVPVNAMGVDH